MTEPGQSRLDPLDRSWRERLSDVLEFRPREVIALAILAVAVVAGAGFAFIKARPKPEPSPSAAGVALVAPATPTASPTTSIVVHVAGAVHKPGVYSFPSGSRVGDAIIAAGGAAPGADINSINLARPLADGERVWIPRKGETPPPEASGASAGPGGAAGGKVNINAASAAQLEDLPGIGPALAERIVEYRTQHGPFRTIRDLMKVTGIGEKKFAALEDYVTV